MLSLKKKEEKIENVTVFFNLISFLHKILRYSVVKKFPYILTHL